MFRNLTSASPIKVRTTTRAARRSHLAPRRPRLEPLEARQVLSVSPTSITIGPTSPIFTGGTQTEPISITLPAGSVATKVDVDLLLDDTGSFESFASTVESIFSTLVTDLQTALPAVDFGFGVTRFEDYGGTAGTAISGDVLAARPFILNQPIVNGATATAASTTVASLIATALGNTAPGFGGDGPEATMEALYQIATGAGLDGNANGNTTDSGAAGAQTTQTAPGDSGDVPAFSTNVLPASGTLGGVGWRPDALHLVLVAGDFTPAAAFTGATAPTTITGSGGSEPFTAFEPVSGRVGPVGTAVPAGGATVQSTVNALNALGIRVLAMGPGAAPTTSTTASDSPSTWYSAIGRLTGAVDDGGNPLVFSTSVDSETLTTSIVNAIKTTATAPIDVGLTTTTLPTNLTFTNLTGIVHNVAPGGTANFSVQFGGMSVAGTFDIQFIDVASNAVLGSIPVTVTPPSTTTLTPAIDILPGSPTNKIDLTSKCNLPVAVLSSSTFDATKIDISDLSTIHFGDVNLSARVSPVSAQLRDINCDGKKDLLLCFSIPTIASTGALVAGSTHAECTGMMQDESTFRGTDSVTVTSSSSSTCMTSCFIATCHATTDCGTHTTSMWTHTKTCVPTWHAPPAVCKAPVTCTPAAKWSYRPAVKTPTFSAHDAVFHSIGISKTSACTTSFSKATAKFSHATSRWGR